MIKRIIQSIPNTITSMNLLSGLIAVYFSFHAAEMFGPLAGFQWVFIAIGAAALFDFCDGASARLLHAYSELGKELDSLADMVSFGVAPAMLLLNTISTVSGGSWVSYAALFIPLMGALRLAKFNIDDTQSVTFSGLPIPANAIFWIGFTAWIWGTGYCPSAWVTLPVIAFVSLLMVSRMRMFSLKFKNFALRENFSRYVILLATVVFVAMYGVSGLMWTIMLYVLISAVVKKN